MWSNILFCLFNILARGLSFARTYAPSLRSMLLGKVTIHIRCYKRIQPELKDCNCWMCTSIYGAGRILRLSTTWSIAHLLGTTDLKGQKWPEWRGRQMLYMYELTPNDFFTNPNGLTMYRWEIVLEIGEGPKREKPHPMWTILSSRTGIFNVNLYCLQSHLPVSLERWWVFSNLKLKHPSAATISIWMDGLEVKKAADCDQY